jgi:Subtilase family
MMKPSHFRNLCLGRGVKLWSLFSQRVFCAAPSFKAGVFLRISKCPLALLVFTLVMAAANGESQDLTTIGVTSLRQIAPGLTGSGVYVGQAEAGNPTWEVSPAAVGQPVSLFTWISTNGSDSTFPNGGGFESGHADRVGNAFYGNSAGVAPGVSHINNYTAEYFYGTVVSGQVQVTPVIVNQSYIFGGTGTANDLDFDNYTARYGTLFVNGVGNGGPVSSPATAFNGIGVGAYGGNTSVGPTTDGRCKPDITAPADFTSFSTPLVAGVATLLLQAAKEGAGGSISAATNALTLKALLLNGASKPPDWTNSTAYPLDARYGAGIVHAVNSYRSLRGGKQGFTVNTTSTSLAGHLPPAANTNIYFRRGWDYNTLSSSTAKDSVNHYFFDVGGTSRTSFVFTATLGWQKGVNQALISNFDLYLYNVSNNVLVASSQSTANNVEHIYVPSLPPGRYDLQVLKSAAAGLGFAESYAVSWDFGPIEAPRITSATVTNGQLVAQVMGEPNQRITLQSTTDYQTWTSLRTNNTSWQGVVSFTNAATGSFKAFRAVQLE